MNDGYFIQKTGPDKNIVRFQNKLIVFVALTNCFCKNFYVLLEFRFYLFSFCCPMTYCP